MGGKERRRGDRAMRVPGGAARRNEGRDGDRERALGLGLELVGAAGPERPVGSAQVERKWPEAWLGLPLSSLSLIFSLAENN